MPDAQREVEGLRAFAQSLSKVWLWLGIIFALPFHANLFDLAA